PSTSDSTRRRPRDTGSPPRPSRSTDGGGRGSRARREAATPTGAGGGARRPGQDRAEVLERIAALHEAGLEVQEIADLLNDEGVRTLFGTEKWWPSTVQTALRYWRGGVSLAALAPR